MRSVCACMWLRVQPLCEAGRGTAGWSSRWQSHSKLPESHPLDTSLPLDISRNRPYKSFQAGIMAQDEGFGFQEWVDLFAWCSAAKPSNQGPQSLTPFSRSWRLLRALASPCVSMWSRPSSIPDSMCLQRPLGHMTLPLGL